MVKWAAALLLSLGLPLVAQQTGTIIGRTPGSPVGRPLQTVPVPRPVPSCESPGLAPSELSLPEMIFSRMMTDWVCLRHGDGSVEKLATGGPWMALSQDGNELAYWVPEKHELHVFAVTNRSDTVVDSVPGATLREIAWSSKGRTLAYWLHGGAQSGLRVLDLESGKRQRLNAALSGIVALPDAEHLVTVGFDGVQRIRLADGRREQVAAVKYANAATYSRSGALLGILASNVNDAAVAADDDEPDCTGGTSALFVQVAATGKLVKIPYPKGFDSVHDFAFSPDDRSIAVTFGAAACDYPGDVARVYLVSLPGLTMKPISPADRLSVKAQWSPDSRVIVYSAYTPGELALMAFDTVSGKTTKLTSPGDDGPDEILGWFMGERKPH